MIVNGRELNNQKRRYPRQKRQKSYNWRVLEVGLKEHRAPVTERFFRNLMQYLKESGTRIGHKAIA